ncbi:hypothetical protein Adt_36285 [Abeliophyllum distichum]|uniref:Uncharacterized protein n=1 Tax=Abeliophyllum distichum TaxID=126358 RepID=A0ABD1QH48_9LAMI
MPLPLRTRLNHNQHLSFRDAPLLPSLSHLGLRFSTVSISHSKMRLYYQASPTWDYTSPSQHLLFKDAPLPPSLSYLGLGFSAASISYSVMRLCYHASPTWD